MYRRAAPGKVVRCGSCPHDFPHTIQEVFFSDGIDLKEFCLAAAGANGGTEYNAGFILEQSNIQTDAVAPRPAKALKHSDAAPGLTVRGDEITPILQRSGDAAL